MTKKDCRGRSKVPVVRKKGRFSRKPFEAPWSHPNAGGVAAVFGVCCNNAEFNISVTRA